MRATALVFALCLAPAAARADARAEARRHFRTGMQLIEQGKYEEGIRQLEAAYAIKPHPNCLFNMGRAWLDAGRGDRALEAYRRYLASDPPDRTEIEALVARIERIVKRESRAAEAKRRKPREEPRPAPAPPPAPAETAAAPAAPSPDVAQLTRTAERIEQLAQRLENMLAETRARPAATAETGAETAADAEAAVEPADTATTDEPGAAPEQALAAEAAALAGAEGAGEVYEELVVTASRRSQTSLEAPAATTVITDEDIRLSGATSIPEVLRRVPGIDVAEMNAADVNLSIRGFNRRLANKLLVLVDGRSVYQDFLGATFWPMLHIGVEDIARIEVVRGPGSALYGANAFAGVVNIITRTPAEAQGNRVVLSGGERNSARGAYAFGGRSGKLSYRTSIGFDRGDKWSLDYGKDRPDVAYQGADPNLSRALTRFDAQIAYEGRTESGDPYRAGAAAGYNNFFTEVVPIGALRVFYLDGFSIYGRADAGYGPAKLKVYWNHLDAITSPQWWPVGLRPIASRMATPVVTDTVDAEAQGDFSLELAGSHHLIVGAGYRFKSGTWEFLSVAPTEHHWALFGQEEWRPQKAWLITASLRVDGHPLLPAPVPSPRASVVFTPAEGHALRASVATAFRVPTFLESYIDVTPPVPPFTHLAVRFQGDRSLRPEQLLSAELGYRNRLFDRVEMDVAGYWQRVQDLIVQGRLTAPPDRFDAEHGVYLAGASTFENDPSLYFAAGVEAGARIYPTDGVDVWANYAFELIADRAGAAAQQQTAQHKGYLGVQWRSRFGLDLAADLHLVSPVTWVEREFDPSAATGVVFPEYDLPGYALLNARAGYRLPGDRFEVWAAAYNALDVRHREHPFGNEIGRRVMAGVTAQF
jgi:iron complex outermembrane receptor protein